MKILVTGGAGFIGSHLIDRLLAKNEEVVCIDNFLLGKKEHLINALENNRFQFNQFDLLDLDKLDSLFKMENFNMVFHLAANSDIQLGFKNVDTDFKNTFLSTFNILKCMKKYNVKSIFFASSSAIYGEYEGRIHEDAGPLLPASNYGSAKLASEAYISSFSKCYNINAWILRFPNVVGFRLTHGVINDFLFKLDLDKSKLNVLGDGKQEKPYLYISDLLDAIDLVLKTEKQTNIFNVSSQSSTTVEFIAKSVLKELKLDETIIQYSGGERGWIGDVPKFEYNTSKIFALGWVPQYTSNEAVLKSIRAELVYQNKH